MLSERRKGHTPCNPDETENRNHLHPDPETSTTETDEVERGVKIRDNFTVISEVTSSWVTFDEEVLSVGLRDQRISLQSSFMEKWKNT